MTRYAIWFGLAVATPFLLALDATGSTQDDIGLFVPSTSFWAYGETQPDPDYIIAPPNTSSLGGWGDGATGVPMFGDVTGDGVDEVVIAQATGGAISYNWLSKHSTIGAGGTGVLGTDAGPGSGFNTMGQVANKLALFMEDINGDGRDDAIYVGDDPGGSGGITFLGGLSDVNGLAKDLTSVGLGNTTLGDIPIVGDVNGDGYSDAVIYRNGGWFTRLSDANGFTSTPGGASVAWGAAGDVPLLGDINGDGTDDAVLFRNGSWFSRLTDSSGAITGVSAGGGGFGTAGDIPFLADINGDGFDDMMIFRPGDNFWSVKFSVAGQLTTLSGGDSTTWGDIGAIPLVGQFTVSTDIPGDFDGDGDVDRDDLANHWEPGFGTASGAGIGDGDANGDGTVNGTDFLIWQNNFTGPSATVSAAAAVPEPSSILLVCAALGMLLCYGKSPRLAKVFSSDQ